ncbi:hypothetical protein BC938DRAFT_482212 [Jimgerdemannia flammicorona]|uniref:PIPK domain-containing protein n=1 Tax=Jimgerdemannia flammicorona TaxID=994334 RepID=A0A433QWG6_9FUNG|nr:hypothetical protein BC938DRAFT_482212 [Jimgerdemannia flammicorona]
MGGREGERPREGGTILPIAATSTVAMATLATTNPPFPGAFPSTPTSERSFTFRSVHSFTKPLPALPSNDPSHPLPSLPVIPRLLTDDLPLDTRSLAHLRALLRQALDNSLLDHDPWERVIITIVIDVADQIPSVIELLATHDRAVAALAASTKSDEAATASSAPQPPSNHPHLQAATAGIIGATKAILSISSALTPASAIAAPLTPEPEKIEEQAPSVALPSPVSLPPRYCIMLAKEESPMANPHESYYVYNRFTGVSLLQRPEDDALNHTKYRYIGGTIVLKGTSSDLVKVSRIFELLIFVVCNLKLEMAVMRDHHVKRETQDPKTEDKYKSEAEEVHNTVRLAKKVTHKGIFGWIMRRNQRISSSPGLGQNPTPSPNNHLSHRLSFSKSSTVARPISSVPPAPPTKEQRLPGSWVPTPPATPGQRSLNSLTMEEPEDVWLPSHRFADIISNMESSVVSSSPDVVFPPPYLLVRLKEEENRVNRFGENLSHTLISEERNIRALYSPDLANNADFASATPWNSTRLPNTPLSRPSSLPQHILAYSTLRANNTNILDAKTGLSHLTMNTRTVDGLIQYQSFSYSYSSFLDPKNPIACEGPRVVTLDFYRFHPRSSSHADRMLGEIIEFWCEGAYQKCEGEGLQKGCGRDRIRHIMTFTHGSGRVNAIVDEALGARDNDADKALQELRDVIVMWTECKLCQARTFPLRMSDATYRYSFGKYLELLLYNPRFIPHEPLCEHVSPTAGVENVVRCFQRNGLVVWFECERVDLFEMRVPRLQCVPNEDTKGGVAKGALESVAAGVRTPGEVVLGEDGVPVEGVTEEEEREEATNATRKEITHFYRSLDRHIAMLDGYVVSEEKFLASHVDGTENRMARTSGTSLNTGAVRNAELGEEVEVTSVSSERRLQLERMADEFGRERDALDETLIRSTGECLNDARRTFAKKVEATKDQIKAWQAEKCPELDAECPWVVPEYVTSKDYLKELVQLQHVGSPSSTPGAHDYFPTTRPSPAHSLRNLIPGTQFPGLDAEDSDPDDGYLVLDEYYTTIHRITDRDAVTAHAAQTFGTSLSGNLKGLAGLGSFGAASSRKPSPSSSAPASKNSSLNGNGNANGWAKGSETEEAGGLPREGEEGMPHSVATPGLLGGSITDSPAHTEDAPGPGLGGKNPHVKYEFTHSNSRFTCTIYFAAQFDALRRKCGIDKLCLQSLSRCATWNVSGGKSKSNFFKTKDDRLVLKQMVSSWNIAEKDALLKFAPKYFDYMDQSVESPTLLAKIFGFYTIKMKNLANNQTAMKMDVLVMEHLFFGQTITRKFDLKGIQDRHVKETKVQQNDTTLWDGDWVEGRYKTLLLIHSHSKRIIRESIRNDTQFLANANIMDYSLLVGVDDEQKELVVGIVDFIGAFTWYKKIESKSKSTLKPHKEVTVLPPEQYKARFRDAMEQYFLSVPDKWVKPVSEIPPPPSIPRLPSASALPAGLRSPASMNGLKGSTKDPPPISLTAPSPIKSSEASLSSVIKPESEEKKDEMAKVRRLPTVL